MKLKKKSGVIGLVSVLAGVSIISVGFASWVISGGTSESVEGNILVETVSDARFMIFTQGTEGNGKLAYNPKVSNDIVFGQPATMSNSSAWLTASNGQTQALTATVTFYVANIIEYNEGTSQYVAKNNFTLTAAFAVTADNDDVTTAVDDLLIELPSAALTPVVDPTDNFTFGDPELRYAKVTVAVEFKWGKHFGANNNATTNTNPYTFYNTGHGSDDELTPGVSYSDDAVIQLKKIEALAEAKFTVTLTTAPSAQ